MARLDVLRAIDRKNNNGAFTVNEVGFHDLTDFAQDYIDVRNRVFLLTGFAGDRPFHDWMPF